MALASPDGLIRPSPEDVAARTAGVVAADELARARVVQLLESARIKVVVETADALSAAKRLEGEAVAAVVVVDDSQHRAMAQEVRTLRAQLPAETLIAVVGADDRRGAVQSALAAGARAFVALDRLEEAFVPSVAAALAGQLVVPGARKPQLHSHVLTSREKQVLALVVMRMTNAEIAAKMYLAESTVKSHLSSAFSKLGVRSRNEAAAAILDPHSGMGTGILTIPTSDDWGPAET